MSIDTFVDIMDLNNNDETGRRDKEILKLKQDTAKHISETLLKDKGFSKRLENTGKDGKDLFPPIINYIIPDGSNNKHKT